MGQPVLCAAWAALATVSAWRRVSWALLALAALAATNVVDDDRPATGVFFVMLFVGHVLILWFVRAKYGWRLTASAGEVTDRATRQFGVRTLLAWTTTAAVVAAMLRWLAEAGNLPALPVFFTIIAGFGVSLTPMLLAVDLVLASRPRSVRTLSVYAIMTAGLVFTGGLLVSLSRRPPSGFFFPILLLSLGAIVDALFTAFVLRRAGYRMVSNAPPTREP